MTSVHQMTPEGLGYIPRADETDTHDDFPFRTGADAVTERCKRSIRDLSGRHEPIGEAIGLALDRGIEHLDRVRIVLVCEYGAFRVQYEAGRLHLLANGCRLNPMQRLGVARACPGGGGVVYDDVGPTGLQPLVDSSIEEGRRRAPGLD